MINQIMEIVQFIVKAFMHAWPYLLITIPLAVIINVSGVSRHIHKIFTYNPLLAILLATAAGAFSPFCSCGVIPVISALLISGVPVAPVMSFWLASPSMDPEIFFLSVSQLGWDIAVWRLAGTFVMSLSAGFITHFLIRRGWISPRVLKMESKSSLNLKIRTLPQRLKRMLFPRPLEAAAVQCCSGSVISTAADAGPDADVDYNSFRTASVPGVSVGNITGGSCTADASCSSKEKESGNTLRRRILAESQSAVFMVLKFMTIAFLLEGLIILYIPQEWIVALLGTGNRFSILISVLIGIPLYTSNLAALGLIGGLLEQGMSPGAALAFLIAGATTTLPAMAAVFGIVKRRIFFLYIGFTVTAALLTGLIYEGVLLLQ